MTRSLHQFQTTWFGVTQPYPDYIRHVGRSFFLRNIAENATMLGFLGWCTILHFGPNSEHYPFFRFKPSDWGDGIFGSVLNAGGGNATDPSSRGSGSDSGSGGDTEEGSYTWEHTMLFSLGAFAFELLSAYITRTSFKRYFKLSVTREAVMEFARYPEVVFVMCLVVVHVLMNMLVALVDLSNFA
ncbi:hypothetical protein HK102_001168 [Quaeritorhiza haematococci]|nr:hypothetical protein HK102_001168 [Quaeritorhiza haematococci]